MTKEVVRAHETGKAFIPVRYNISHAEFQQRQPEWNIVIGAAASIPVTLDGVPAIIPRIARGLQQLSPPRDERIPRSSEAIPATESAPKARAEPQPSEAETTVRYAADQISKAHTDLQRPAESPGRSGVVDSRAGQGAIRRGDKSVYVAVAFLGSLVVIGGATYLFRGDAPVQPVPSEVSKRCDANRGRPALSCRGCFTQERLFRRSRGKYPATLGQCTTVAERRESTASVIRSQQH
jgi:hypothetical protein